MSAHGKSPVSSDDQVRAGPGRTKQNQAGLTIL